MIADNPQTRRDVSGLLGLFKVIRVIRAIQGY